MIALSELTVFAWVLLVAGALVVGITKTGLPGMITLPIAAFATVLPAKASTSALLLVLIIADMFAVSFYTRYTQWRVLFRLMPAVIAGIALGALFFVVANDEWVQRVIAVILLLLVAYTIWQRRTSLNAAEKSSEEPRGNSGDQDVHNSAKGTSGARRLFYGVLSGFNTMVANAGGPVISLYFLASRFNVMAFLGTAAWFFAVVNISKVPIAIGLGIMTIDTLWLALLLSPAVIAGALAGRLIARHISQQAFDLVVIVGTLIGALYLLFA